jgi:hypothetical protein
MYSEPTDVLLFFITGNPGLVSYYEPFLTHLHTILSSDDPTRRYHYYGSSHAGFDTKTVPTIISDLPHLSIPAAEAQRPAMKDGPYDIEYQIDFKIAELTSIVQSWPEGRQVEVVLIAHSMGSFIILEMLHKINQLYDALPSATSAGKQRAGQKVVALPPSPKLALLLFPTVVEIAKSPSGQQLGPFFRSTNFPERGQAIVNFLLWFVPLWLLHFILVHLAGHSKDGTKTTVALASTPGVVRQVLFMARDEMSTIDKDRWDESVWGAETTVEGMSHPRTKLVFFFGRNDHWVAETTRKDLIKVKARVDKAAKLASAQGKTFEEHDEQQHGLDTRPVMVVDEDGIGHAFCFYHSEPVAKHCEGWVREVFDLNFEDETVTGLSSPTLVGSDDSDGSTQLRKRARA